MIKNNLSGLNKDHIYNISAIDGTKLDKTVTSEEELG